LKAAWQSVEFGNYAGAAATVQKSLASSEPNVKAMAEKLNAVIQEGIDSQTAQARSLMAQGKKWQAYQLYLALVESYKGIELPTDVLADKKTLAEDPAIKKELVAAKSLDRIKINLKNARPNMQKPIIVSL